MARGRPARAASTLNANDRRQMLSYLLGVWDANPKWTFGQLVERVLTVPTGERARLDAVTDSDVFLGIDSLVPADWEVEEHGARPVEPRLVETLEEQLERHFAKADRKTV